MAAPSDEFNSQLFQDLLKRGKSNSSEDSLADYSPHFNYRDIDSKYHKDAGTSGQFSKLNLTPSAKASLQAGLNALDEVYAEEPIAVSTQLKDPALILEERRAAREKRKQLGLEPKTPPNSSNTTPEFPNLSLNITTSELNLDLVDYSYDPSMEELSPDERADIDLAIRASLGQPISLPMRFDDQKSSAKDPVPLPVSDTPATESSLLDKGRRILFELGASPKPKEISRIFSLLESAGVGVKPGSSPTKPIAVSKPPAFSLPPSARSVLAMKSTEEPVPITFVYDKTKANPGTPANTPVQVISANASETNNVGFNFKEKADILTKFITAQTNFKNQEDKIWDEVIRFLADPDEYPVNPEDPLNAMIYMAEANFKKLQKAKRK